MQLHWDGNNASLAGAEPLAAMGAGVTPDSVDHDSIERVADWLLDLRPPPSPYRPDPVRSRAVATFHAHPRGAVMAIRTRRTTCSRAKSSARSRRMPASASILTLSTRIRIASARIQLTEFFEGTEYQFKALQEDRRIRQRAARRPVAKSAVSAQRCGADAWRTYWSLRKKGRTRSFAASTRSMLSGGGFVAPPCSAAPMPGGRSASTRASPETARMAIATAPTCRRKTNRTCSPTCSRSEPTGPPHEPATDALRCRRRAGAASFAPIGLCF